MGQKDKIFYLIWFPNDLTYSIVEGTSIKQSNPTQRDKLHVKDVRGTWEGIVYASGRITLLPTTLVVKLNMHHNGNTSTWFLLEKVMETVRYFT